MDLLKLGNEYIDISKVLRFRIIQEEINEDEILSYINVKFIDDNENKYCEKKNSKNCKEDDYLELENIIEEIQKKDIIEIKVPRTGATYFFNKKNILYMKVEMNGSLYIMGNDGNEKLVPNSYFSNTCYPTLNNLNYIEKISKNFNNKN